MADKWLNKDGTDPAAQYPPDWQARALAAEKQAEIDADRANVYRDKWQAAEKQLATLAESGTGYSQQTVDAIVKERDALRATVARVLAAAIEWQDVRPNLAIGLSTMAIHSANAINKVGAAILAIINDKETP